MTTGAGRTQPVTLIAVAALGAIVVWRARRSAKQRREVFADDYQGPEPTPAEVEAAKATIRRKTSEDFQAHKSRTWKSLLALLLIICANIPFLKGMPLHRLFRPWGTLAAVAFVPAFGLSLLLCGLLVNRWQHKRFTEKWLESLDEPE